LPAVSLADVDTTDINNPIVGVDVSARDPYHPIEAVILEVNGITVGYISWQGNARYGLHLPAIPFFNEGSTTVKGPACLSTGNCNEHTLTTFSFPESGGNSHVQVKDSLVTISGHDPMPMWTAGAWTSGTYPTGNYGIYDPSPNPNLWQCSNGYICDSKVGRGAVLFGYTAAVHEGLWSFVIEGWNATYSGGSLDIDLAR
jgi:hypothetical protein